MGQRHLNQTLTYWPPGQDDRYGKPLAGAPIQIDCRWEDRIDEVQSKTGQEVTSRSRIFIEGDVDLDGYVYLGVTAVPDPSKLDGAYEIQAKGHQPDLRGLRELTVIYI